MWIDAVIYFIKQIKLKITHFITDITSRITEIDAIDSSYLRHGDEIPVLCSFDTSIIPMPEDSEDIIRGIWLVNETDLMCELGDSQYQVYKFIDKEWEGEPFTTDEFEPLRDMPMWKIGEFYYTLDRYDYGYPIGKVWRIVQLDATFNIIAGNMIVEEVMSWLNYQHLSLHVSDNLLYFSKTLYPLIWIAINTDGTTATETLESLQKPYDYRFDGGSFSFEIYNHRYILTIRHSDEVSFIDTHLVNDIFHSDTRYRRYWIDYPGLSKSRVQIKKIDNNLWIFTLHKGYQGGNHVMIRKLGLAI